MIRKMVSLFMHVKMHAPCHGIMHVVTRVELDLDAKCHRKTCKSFIQCTKLRHRGAKMGPVPKWHHAPSLYEKNTSHMGTNSLKPVLGPKDG